MSKNLHHWIDLIFGYKQKGEEARAAVNVFRSLSYEGEIDLNKIKDKREQTAILEQIFHLGQTPTQLFIKEHPSREVTSTSHKIYELIPRYHFGRKQILIFY